MKLENLTIGQLDNLMELINSISEDSASDNSPVTEKSRVEHHGEVFFEVGKSYFIRTVTHHYLGSVVAILPDGIVVKNCVWVADNGRFHKLTSGEWDEKSEREPYPPEKAVMLYYQGMLDSMEWEWVIPGDVK